MSGNAGSGGVGGAAARVVRPEARHRAEWDALYAGYARFYRVEQTAAMRDRVWGWIGDPAHEVEAFVAEGADGRLLGLAHFRPYARPLSASTGGFLDDLFVDPAARGRRIAALLIDAVRAEAAGRGWTVLRWITAEDNAAGRAAYDRVATLTGWRTYDVVP